MVLLNLVLSLAFVILLSAAAYLLLTRSIYSVNQDAISADGQRSPRFQVLVLGDVGRSPRMQYHAISLAKHGAFVDLIGYVDSELHPDIVTSNKIQVLPLWIVPRALQTKSKGLFLLYGPLKVIYQVVGLWYVLNHKAQPARWLLVQNPPSIPTLVVAQAACWLRRTKLVIDWHNFGYTILALKLGYGHPLVKASELYDRYASRGADAHFTVTKAMAKILRENFKLSAPILTLHDRPAAVFKPMSIEHRLAFLGRLPETALHIDNLAEGKLKVLVSSTSWTPDEDFSLLLDALVEYSDRAISTHPHLPELLVIVTGKGALRDHYLKQIEELRSQDKLEMVIIKTAWLSTQDYASLLASADLGISLHQSTSGVDLPMKVLDMFGAGLPVVGWSRFEAWPELVTEGVNGKGFGSAEELMEILTDLLGSTDDSIQTVKRGALQESTIGWDANWDGIAGRLFAL
ncbi:mannosyltransferase [Agyrium rufum]|nr:mannosyltransferase [Agyrium rufum]